MNGLPLQVIFRFSVNPASMYSVFVRGVRIPAHQAVSSEATFAGAQFHGSNSFIRLIL